MADLEAPAAAADIVRERDPNTTEHSSAGSSKEKGINVEQAEQDFARLQRTLSQRSRENITQERDVEANGNDDEKDFDLQEYLSSVQSRASAAGIKRKAIGVTWKNLTVAGNDALSLKIKTFPDSIMLFFLGPILHLSKMLNRKGPGERRLLTDFNGALRPGEMCLVLGRPNSGTSVFLKTIANQRAGFLHVEGEVKYGGMSAEEFHKRYVGEVVYSEEDDLHFPTLTVGRTLDFALRTKSPGKLLPDYTPARLREEVSTMLLRMLGISHTRDTLVGSAFVRGISGGERKRVSIAQIMCTRASISAWDNSTRGLDASTALDFAKSLRILTSINQTATFASFYQAGEGIYETFDKVLVIDNGHCVYYGPRDEARRYFISLGFADLPRQTTGDYLTGCTDPNERRFQEGRDAFNVPSTPESLEEAYRHSDIYRRALQGRDEYAAFVEKERSIEEEFRQAIRDDKHKSVSKRSKYTVSFLTQVQALFIRQMQISLGDKLDIFISFATNIAIAIIVGSCFLLLPPDASGSFERGSVIFIGLLQSTLTAFNELPTQMKGKPILYVQQNLAFYRPSALAVANLLSDIPFSLPRIFLCTICLYKMAGLRSSFDAFWTHFLVAYVLYLACSRLFGIFGTICHSYDVAARVAAVIITCLVMFAGYMIPRDDLSRWLVWITYLSPMYYGFSALMINEFSHLTLSCVGDYITPRNVGSVTKYPGIVGENQVCTLSGAASGSQVVPGRAYIAAAFGYKVSDLWLNAGIVFVFLFGLLAINCIVIEVVQHGQFSSALKITKKPSAEEKKLNEALRKRREKETKNGTQESLEIVSKPFTWEGINYTVPVRGGQRRLLHDVYGYCKPGTLTALMGSSGAGKTTLLDVLADRKTIGVISGERLINGRPINKDFQRGCAYAEQQDVHEPTTTVREAMRFSAYLRQPAHVSKADKDRWVEECIALLEMEPIADAMIGTAEFGLGIADRKRCTIGVELAAKPSLLLFLDEPSSGLDGQSAYNVVRFLKKLAAAGQAILCTIHQPNSLLFENFDRLLLLERGGETVYFGPVGKDSCHIIDYFAQNGAQCPSDVNPAEYMLEAIGAGSSKRVGPRDWADIYRESALYKENLAEIDKIKSDCLAIPEKEVEGGIKEYATPFSFQLKTVLKRTILASWRMSDYQFTRLFQHGSMALVTGLIFLQLGDSVRSLQYRSFAIFAYCIIPAIILAQIEPYFIMARSTFYREATSKMYTPEVFALSQFLAEMPYSVLCALVFWLLFYWPIGLQSASDRAGYAFAMTMVVEVFAVTLGQAVAALSPSVYIAGLINPFLIVFMTLLCGVTIEAPKMPKFWRSWAWFLNPASRIIGGLLSNEVEGLDVRCSATEWSVFSTPTNDSIAQTCQQWAGSFVTAAGGYLDNPNDTSDCRYCQYRTGADYLRPLNISFSNRGREIGILLSFCLFNGFLTVALTRLLRYSNR